MTGTGTAHADAPTVIDEDSTGFSCAYYPEGAPQVSTSIHYDAISGEGYSYAEVLTPDGEGHVAYGNTTDVTVADGIVSAQYPLFDDDGSPGGEVVLQGTYEAAASPVTLHPRYRMPERNAQIIGTLTYTELAVTWTTLSVGDYDVTGMTCSGDRTQTSNRVLQPHRLVYTFEQFRLLEDCAQAPLTRLDVVGSEVGVSLFMATADLQGETNLALGDGNDTQDVSWYDGDGQPAAVTPITASITPDGHTRTMVDATPQGLVLERIQPITFTYELGLPDGTGTVTGSCAAQTVIGRSVVEPFEEPAPSTT